MILPVVIGWLTTFRFLSFFFFFLKKKKKKYNNYYLTPLFIYLDMSYLYIHILYIFYNKKDVQTRAGKEGWSRRHRSLSANQRNLPVRTAPSMPRLTPRSSMQRAPLPSLSLGSPF
jgi:hypothetical protein